MKFKEFYIIIKLIVVAVSLSGICQAEEELTIYAAAGTRLVTEEIANLFEQEKGIKVIRNYASSGTLARQIASGGDCDVYVSANRQWVDFLLEKNILVPSSVKSIAGNYLALITAADSDMSDIKFTKDFAINSFIKDKFVIGDPAYVPVGKYAKEFLVNLNWFDSLKEKTILTKDVSSVLHYVEIKEADLGVVYYSEAIKSLKVKVLTKVPDNLHKKIVFFVADLKGQHKEASELSLFFSSEKGKAIFTKHGFSKV